MKSKIAALIGILILVSANLKANTDGEVKKINSNRVEIIKDYLKNAIASEKMDSDKLQQEELLAIEAYVSEQGDVVVENMNFSNYFWAESVKQKLQKIHIHDASDISGEKFTMRFKYYQK